MPLDIHAKNIGLNAIGAVADGIAVHSADPGTGATAETSVSRPNPTFAAASGGNLNLATAVQFTGAAPSAGATWFTVWDGVNRLAKGQITSGDQAFNAEGVFNLTTDTKLEIVDPV